ncbi:MAG: hypothetical protein Q8Q75_08065 [Rhodoferax sp.]|uniref:hypothetical protein n=1 Tax=Rhodoferax sp. TaxID=50421 RepID=UPI00273591CD|nr:hypothetical protein [Rhodoferax sp.]MDP3338582.1 hypothetical protein [Rhodoferax sp.]MDP3864658.1 hypothetical protein [Rhodoferax sp.]
MAIIVAVIAGCAGFFLGAIAIGVALSGKVSDAVLNLVSNLLTFVGVGAGAYLGFRQLNVGVSQIAEGTRQATLDRTMHFVSAIEARYRGFDSGAWRKHIDEFNFLLPIANLPKSRIAQFIAHAEKSKEFKEIVELLNLAGEAFHGVEIGVYNEKYVFERSFQFFFDLWRSAWPLIAMEREKERTIFPGAMPTYMLDLENFLRKHDAIFVPLPTVVQS